MQDILIYLTLFLIGAPLLIKSSDYCVIFASKYSQLSGISKTAIGAIIISTLTSLPELFVAIASIPLKESEIIIGNLLGANITNVLLLIGISAAIFGIKIKNKIRFFEMIIFATIPFLYGLFFTFDATLGFLCLIIFFSLSKNLLFPTKKSGKRVKNRKKELEILSKLLFSILILLASAEIIVLSIKNLSEIIGFSKTIFSALILSLLTTLPELSVSIASSKRKEYEILLGNIFGSCFVNVNLIFGFSLLFSKFLLTTKEILLIFISIISYLSFVIFALDNKIERLEALIMILIYILYVFIGFSII
ncbi:MAG: hypothetical protein QXZ20_03145 [Candidatus Aenigmatarchaeota archaeon]